MHLAHPRTPLSKTLINQVLTHGSPEERRLIETHGLALAGFLDHPDIQLHSKRAHLEMVLENRIALSFNMITTPHSASWGLIDQIGAWAPSLRNLSETILRHKLRSHVGIKIRPDLVEYELYVYETQDHLLSTKIFPEIKTKPPGLPGSVHCYGYTSSETLSAYAITPIRDAAGSEETDALQLFCEGIRSTTLFNSKRRPDGTWITNRLGIELIPFPSHILNAVLAQLDLRFSYLLYRGGTRPYGIVGITGSRQALRTNLIPQPSNNF